MSLRRNLALLTSAVAIATTFSSCGFDLATDRVYTPAAGTNDRETEVNVLSAMVVSSRDGAGTFIAGLANTGTSEDSLKTVAPTDTGITADDFDPIAVTANGYTHVGSDDAAGIGLVGDFSAGQTLEISFTFSNGETTTMNVPVVPACREFTGYDTASDGRGTGDLYDCQALEPVTEPGGNTAEEETATNEEGEG
ncbi:hypothetical protein [Nocardioides sp. GY 10127]|uniref:hypothetical protein n=1 Tax=Nocardioides sp. GY 10127 TaxID=2569762 RepID=UPI0010A93EAB|nr:hypothetical protein [Nocardioides sp. GY 10127]TIC78902.1 hypothetical protein E8D37_18660 [Nocardioides sp. GY 10127]